MAHPDALVNVCLRLEQALQQMENALIEARERIAALEEELAKPRARRK